MGLHHFPVSWTLVGFIFSSTLFLYNLHALIRFPEKIGVPRYQRRYAWVSRYRGVVMGLMALGGGFSMLCLALLPVRLWGAVGVLGALSLAYSVPVFRGVFPGTPRLRDIPYVKFFVLVTVLTATVVGLPGILVGQLWGWTLARMWLFMAAITLPFDIRDLDFDRGQGLATLVTALGESRARGLAEVLLVGSAVVTRGPMAGVLLVSLIPVAIVIGQSRTEKSGLFYGVWVEGCLLVQSGLWYIFS